MNTDVTFYNNEFEELHDTSKPLEQCIYIGHLSLGIHEPFDFSNVMMDEYEIFPVLISNETYQPYQYPVQSDDPDYEIIDSTGLIHKINYYQLDYMMSKVPHIQYMFKIPISKIGPFDYSKYYFVNNKYICDLNNRKIRNSCSEELIRKGHQRCILEDVNGNVHEYEFNHLIEYLQKQFEPVICEMMDKEEAKADICFEIYDTPEEHEEAPLTHYTYPELKARLNLSSYAQFLEMIKAGSINVNDVRE